MRLPSPRTRRILLGLLLVTNPFWGPALEVTGTDYVYESAEITVEENRLVVADEGAVFEMHHGIDGFDCSFGMTDTRYCTLEALTLNESVEVDHPTIVSSTSGYLATEEQYLAYSDGRVYAYNSAWEDGHFVLSTERVSAATALDDVAQSLSTYPNPAAERAIRTEQIQTDEPLWADEGEGRVFELDGTYYVVYQSGSKGTASNPKAEAMLSFFGVVYGAVVLLERD
ncbi:hypothetical protein GJR96_01915 [Haloferax sp. MBLA0076]|uniref:Uncharacterized protein n=1 Tax=Haloferax litoreum TaxID=2666140 RepID=A0A6A8GD21_9EURY|nr:MULTISPECIES: hypothetical protein [Haloferax]KAB1192262.1 hypothetical protein Hfx1148_01905 [Haloferax sp. CBA1148]MRX20719.1 hypothetical protein [Haloferax litoreum]